MDKYTKRKEQLLRRFSRSFDPPVPVDLSREINVLFQVDRRKQRRISEYMCESIRKTKNKAYKSSESLKHTPIPSRPVSASVFRQFTEKSSSIEMPKFLEKSIRKKIQVGDLEQTHQLLLADMMKETKLEFINITHYASINKIIKTKDSEIVFTIDPYKYLGRTKNYHKFLQTRKYFQAKWILHYPVIRKIHKKCVVSLPYEFSKLNFNKTRNINDLQSVFKDKLRNISQYLFEFYLEIMDIVDNEGSKQKQKIPYKTYLGACTGLFSLHVSRCIAHTLLHVLRTTECKKVKPYLILNATFNNDLVLTPTCDEVIDLFHNFLDRIIQIGKELYVLERNKVKGFDNKYISLCLTEEFITNCKVELERNIKKHYEPVLTYLEELSSNFVNIYNDIDSEDFFQSIADIDFENGCKRIKFYTEHLHKVMFIPDNEFFKIGKIFLTDYRGELHDGLNKNIDAIFDKLSCQHFWEVNDLHETFEMIKMRATLKPITTEELIETGKYMTFIRNEHLSELTQRVHGSLSSLCKIIDLGMLSDEHISLNSRVIHWLKDIMPIVDEHLITYDQMKFEAEEKLQKVVEDVSVLIKDVYPILVILNDMDDITIVRSYLNDITLHMLRIKEIDAQIAWINNEEVTLSFPKSTYSEYEDLKNYVYPFYHLLKVCLDVQRNLSVWQDGPFESLHYEKTSQTVDRIHIELTETYKIYKKQIRKAQDENLVLQFKGTVDDPDILNWPAPLKLCGTALRLIEEFKPSVNVMKIICNPCLRKRHWDAMSEIAKIDVRPNAGTTLKKMMKIDFKSKYEEYEIISNGATKEKQLKDDLEELQTQWAKITFKHKDNEYITVLTDLDDIDSLITDQIIKIMSMKVSVFIKPHEKEVQKFHKRILKIQETINNWDEVQVILTKIIPIFSNSDLNNIIPKELDIYKSVYSVYKSLIEVILVNSIVFRIVSTSDITEKIRDCLVNLEVVHKGIITYLEVVREYFPRLYFLSNDELLEGLSKPNHIYDSPVFLNKIFRGFHKLLVDDNNIIGIYNISLEEFKFTCCIERKVVSLEVLCSSLESSMKDTLKAKLVDCYKLYRRTEFKEIFKKFPAQIIQIVSQIYFTEHIESALLLPHNIKLRLYLYNIGRKIQSKITAMKSSSPVDRAKLEFLIINDINNKTLLETMMNGNIPNEHDFHWQAYFKYYYINQIAEVKMLDVELNYAYEYLESMTCFVITPATDKCFRTLVNAFYLHHNGLIRGSSDIGKSETINRLAQAFGNFLVRFNCSKNINISFTRRLLKGNSLCGSWICFENFTNLHMGVLSVISQDLLSILLTKKGKQNYALINSKGIKVSPACFVTACIKTKHLDALPRNLKVQFRTITMLCPDIQKIIETKFYSFGYQSATSLAKKLKEIVVLCENMLVTAEYQYNFGLSKLRNIFDICKLSKVENVEDEETVTYNSVKEIFLPMISVGDQNMFETILQNTFPNAKSISSPPENLCEVIKNIAEEKQLHITESYSKKVVEIYNYITNYNQIIVVGDTWAGKTTMLSICRKMIALLKQQDISCHFINPNYLDYHTLFGNFDEVSEHWSDGVVTNLMRKVALGEENAKTWLIFDGNINSSWIENLYSVVDQEKFYLESGEVLRLSHLTTIFEMKDMLNCSPTIVSRCSLVCVDKDKSSWQTLISSWITLCNLDWINGFKEQIHDILSWITPACLYYIKNYCTSMYYLIDSTIVNCTILLTQMILDDVFSNINKKEEDPRNFPVWIQASLIQAGITGFGSILESSSRYKFDEFYKSLWKGLNEDHPYPKSMEKLEVSIPADGSLSDYQYIYRQRGAWKLYQDLLKTEKIIESTYMREFVVPTPDTLRYSYLLGLFLRYRHPFIFIGPSGTGKTLLIEDLLINKLDEKQTISSQINSTVNLTPAMLQTFILENLNRGKLGKFAPPKNKNFLLFIDNLNLTPCNEFGSLECLELLRQHFDHNVWYGIDTNTEIFIENTNMIGAMGLVEGSKIALCQRFLRHFSIVGISHISDDNLTKIFSNVLINIWRKKNFSSDIVNIANQICESTLNIFKNVLKQCKPTMSRCYYVFDLSSVAKVVQGCTLLKKETYDANKRIHLKLWVHEIMRVFGDRLNSLDNKWLHGQIKEAFINYFNEPLEDIFEANEDKDDPITTLMFGTMNENKRYEEITNIKYLQDIITECLEKYNYYSKVKVNVILVEYAVEKLVKICRILMLSPGNVILLGHSGLGKQTLTKLAAFLYEYKLFQPILTRNFSISDWNNHLKEVLKEAGAVENQCVFLISEGNILEDNYLQSVEHIVRNGEVPGLYNMDEKQEILELARLAAQGGNKNVDISSSSIFLYFNKRCKENLHLVLCLCSSNQALHKRIRHYPALMLCHVLFWDDWPDASFSDIGSSFMTHMNISDDVKSSIVNTGIHFHRYCQGLVRGITRKNQLHTLITPTLFVQLFKLFVKLQVNKEREIISKKSKFEKGLSKLSEASVQISAMQQALAKYEPQLEAMTLKAAEMTEQIAIETIEVEKASALVRKDEKIASEQATVAQRLKSECETELAQAIPILEDAISALNTLKPSDITLVKSMKNPPDAIKLVMAAVCVIKDVKPERIPDPSTGRKTIDYWSPSKRILGDMNFLQTLKDFDKDHIKPEIMVKIRKDYLPHKDFKPHVVAKASSAAEGLCKWIIAMDMYDKVAKEVAPKKEKLEKAEKEYAATMAILTQKKEEVARIEQRLADLNVLLEDAVNKQMKLQKEVDNCNKKLSSAQKLIGSLAGEKIRWTEKVKILVEQETMSVGNILLSCGIIAYLASFSVDRRKEIVNNWHEYISSNNLYCSADFNIIKSLSNDNQIEYWLRNRIPNESFFLENAIIYELSNMYSVFIDPDYSAKNWLESIEKRNNLNVTKFCFDDHFDLLIYCMNVGKPILIHEIKEKLPHYLDPLWSKHFVVENEEKYLIFNDKTYKINPNFRLYLTCNLRYPKFHPDVYKKINLINFSITQKGLEAKLLEIVTEAERPDLRKLRADVYKKKRRNRRELTELENRILKTLCESETDILEDEAAIKILDQSKNAAKFIRDQQEETKETERTIETFRKTYTSVSEYTANLYFCINKLYIINLIYEYSLEYFTETYYKSILQSGKSRNLEKRCMNLINFFTFKLFVSISQSLFKRDRFSFLILLSLSISMFNKLCTEEERNFFLNPEISSDQGIPNPAPDWLENRKWNNVCSLAAVESFEGFLQHFINNIKYWEDVTKTKCLLWNERPPDFHLTNFQILLILQTLQPTEIHYNLKHFIKESLGETFLQLPQFILSECYNESHSLSPILFITTPSSNTLDNIYSLVSKKKVDHLFKYLSFGDGESNKAITLIAEAQQKGSWLLLENCHLSPKLFKTLEKILTNMNYENTHENFRLWLTSEPTTDIPLEFLQNSLKIVDDNSSDLQPNLMRLYGREPIFEPSFFSGCPGKHEIFTKFLLGIGFFYCILLERKQINNAGWKTPYFFDEADFVTSIKQLQMIINEESFSVYDLKKLSVIIGQCHYMGYMENSWDRRLLHTILEDFLTVKILAKNFAFSGINSYQFPKKYDYKNYINLLTEWPLEAGYEIYGIDSCTHQMSLFNRSQNVLSSVLLFFEEPEKKSVQDSEFYLLAHIDDLLSKIPSPIESELTDYVITREITKYNNLLNVMKTSLRGLKDSLGGNIMISSIYLSMANDILTGTIPKIWKKEMFPSNMNLSQYMENLPQRINFFKAFQSGSNNYWLGAFFYPKALIWKSKLDFSKRLNLSLENLVYCSRILSDERSQDSTETIIITGLNIFGARWDTDRDTLCPNVSGSYEEVPPIILYPKDIDECITEDYFKCPIYSHNDFENFIDSILVPTETDAKIWIKRGVKLICQKICK